MCRTSSIKFYPTTMSRLHCPSRLTRYSGATSLTYDQFVNGNVPGVTDPTTNLPMPVLVKGNSANSNLIMALQGIGAAFGPDSEIGQMPANGPPFFTADQIASIAAWIDNGCPQ